jgi:hypothetical protein
MLFFGGVAVGAIASFALLWVMDAWDLRRMSKSFWEADRLHRESIAQLNKLTEQKGARQP